MNLPILPYGLIKATAPAIGPTTPEKSARSPVDNPKLFSSTITFTGKTSPFVKVTVFTLSCNPSFFRPSGVRAACPLVFLVKPFDPTLDVNKLSCSSKVSALPNPDLSPCTLGTPVS